MPRFFMNIRQDDEWLEDREGEEFPSLVEARAEAVMAARELMAARVGAGRKPHRGGFEITDDAGHVVLLVPFEDALGED